MKVVIVSDRYGYPGRRERIEYIVRYFKKYGDFEFIAFDVELPTFKESGLRFLRVNRGDGISKCISYIKGIIGEERFFVVFETSMDSADISGLISHHKSTDSGITVAATRREQGLCKNLGIALIENEYLDLICEGMALEPDIMVRCAEDGDLGVFFN
jgi:hypothetical protein